MCICQRNVNVYFMRESLTDLMNSYNFIYISAFVLMVCICLSLFEWLNDMYLLGHHR